MRAAYLVEPGTIEVRTVDDPVAAAGELVVRVECALTCGTDLKAFRRGHPFIPMPGPFGHQYSGVIDQVGPGLSGFERGMPILGVHSGPCGDCPRCRQGQSNLCERLQEQLVIGAFAEKLRIRPRVVQANVFPRPESIGPLRAAFLEPLSCVVHALELIDFQNTDRVLVLGLGSMGLIFLELLPFYTKADRIGAGRRESRLDMARTLRLTEVIDTEQNPDMLGTAAAGGYDVVIECTGRPEGWQQAIDLTRPGGQVMLFGGLPKGSTFPVDTYRLHYEELKLLGSFHFTPADVRKAASYLIDADLHLEAMIEDCRPLDELARSLNEMAEGAALKFAIQP